MPKIDSIQPPIPPRAVDRPGTVGPGERPADPGGPPDVDEVFAATILAVKVQEMPEVRADLVERVKAEIAAGEYETAERIAAAVNRLLEEMIPE